MSTVDVEMMNRVREELPLKSWTLVSWGRDVLRDPLSLLNDHAHLEKKAAYNALELLTRWPEPNPPENWVKVMTAIARDEVEHLAIVVRLLARRGGELTRDHANPYARDLRGLVRLGEGRSELMDRLMVSALIEARSCERFAVLSVAADDRELQDLYGDLYASEAGHYRVFLGLARELPDIGKVEERWAELLEREATILSNQPVGVRVHSGPTDAL
jgi:tRNA 2-(methylsulfanyl)-N6-isopentenyladenosine37 hydroxylase